MKHSMFINLASMFGENVCSTKTLLTGKKICSKHGLKNVCTRTNKQGDPNKSGVLEKLSKIN